MNIDKKIEKIKNKIEKTNKFWINKNSCNNQEFLTYKLKNNFLVVETLNAETERKMRYKKNQRALVSEQHYFGIIGFPKPVHTQNDINALTGRAKQRFDSLLQAQQNGNIRLNTSITLHVDEWLALRYINKKPSKNEIDKTHIYTKELYSDISKSLKDYYEINNVNLARNTNFIIVNSQQNTNLSLIDYFFNRGLNVFYTYAILGYLLENSGILVPSNFKYEEDEKDSYEIHIPVSELRKLFPNRVFKPVFNVYFNFSYDKNRRNNIAVVTVLKSYIEYYRSIIFKEQNYQYDGGVTQVLSYIKWQHLNRKHFNKENKSFLAFSNTTVYLVFIVSI